MAKKTTKKTTTKKKASKKKSSKRPGNPDWKPGVSGNPEGRPKGSKNTKTLIDTMFNVILPNNMLGNDIEKNIDNLRYMLGTQDITVKQVTLWCQMYKALHGDRQALEMLLDRTDGRPTQHNKNENTEVSYDEFLQSLANKGE